MNAYATAGLLGLAILGGAPAALAAGIDNGPYSVGLSTP